MDHNTTTLTRSTTPPSKRRTSAPDAPEQSAQLSGDAIASYRRWAKSDPTMMASLTEQFSCVWCGKTFNRRCDRNRHHKKHSRPYKCKDCEKTFASRKDRDRHSNIWVHGQQMNYLCTVQGCLSSTTKDDGLYAFGRVDRWRTHMINAHGLSKEEVQTIVKRGIPMENKAIKESPEANTIPRNSNEEAWTPFEDKETLQEDDVAHGDQEEPSIGHYVTDDWKELSSIDLELTVMTEENPSLESLRNDGGAFHRIVRDGKNTDSNEDREAIDGGWYNKVADDVEYFPEEEWTLP